MSDSMPMYSGTPVCRTEGTPNDAQLLRYPSSECMPCPEFPCIRTTQHFGITVPDIGVPLYLGLRSLSGTLVCARSHRLGYPIVVPHSPRCIPKQREGFAEGASEYMLRDRQHLVKEAAPRHSSAEAAPLHGPCVNNIRALLTMQQDPEVEGPAHAQHLHCYRIAGVCWDKTLPGSPAVMYVEHKKT